MINDFMSDDELGELGLGSVGRDVRISRHALVFAPERIHIGDHSRIDAFAILSAGEPGIRMGRNVHVSAYAALLGRAGVEIGNFVAISVRATILTSSGDYSGVRMGLATLPDSYREGLFAPVKIGDFAAIGAASLVLAGLEIGASSSVGALSLVREDVPEFAIVAGIPARRIGTRSAQHRDVAQRLMAEEAAAGTS
jgi:dTDP-4-amino-4,6-dideoxy-D-glucose acyltransferase